MFLVDNKVYPIRLRQKIAMTWELAHSRIELAVNRDTAEIEGQWTIELQRNTER
jgi:hypothetical protein